NVYARDRGRCQYCGTRVRRDEFTYEHVIPRVLGGRTSWENVVVACVACNQRKAGRTPEQARMRLLSTPVKPKRLPDLPREIRYSDEMPESWKSWLQSAVYWDGELETGR
ncbi:MAG TPA: HNH endonuclease, partial [Polyangia bacterium]|nr:HNH endonuclease [Polyangia bacterium]